MAQRFKAKTLLSNSGVFNNEVIAPNLVYNTGNQTIAGLKTFSSGIVSNVGVTGTNLVYNTGDQTIGGVKTFSDGVVSSVGITGTNIVYNTGDQTIGGVKTFSNGVVSSVGITGTNIVYNTGDQTISGTKTFATGVNISGNVGIGTISPSEKLQVVGNIKASGASFDNRPTVNGTGVLLSGDITYVQTNSYFYVDATRTDSYEQNGNILYPYKTLSSAYNAAKNIASFNNPTYITLLSPIAEDLTIDKGYINLVGNNTNKNDPIRITGSLVFAATGIGSTITDNNFSIAGLGVTATSNNKCILFSGNKPQRLFIQDCWLIAKDNGTCLYSNNTNTTSRLQGDILKLSPEGVNTTAIDIVSGTSSISFAETSSSASVLAYVRNNSTLNISNSQIETAGEKAFQVENAARLTLLNSVLTNTANPSTGIFLKDALSTAVIVGSAISVPANANSYAANGVANSYLFYKNLYFSIDAAGQSTESKIGNNINKILINSYDPVVYSIGDQTIGGLKTFSNGVVSSVGITGTNIVYNTGDQTIGGVKTFSDGVVSSVGITGTNIVYNTGDQTIGGVKTFSDGVVSSVGITGTNIVYNTGDQTIGGLKTFSNGVVSSVGITGTNIVYNTGDQTIGGVKTFQTGVVVSGNLQVSGSGIFNSIDLNNVDTVSLSGVDVIITGGNIVLTNRPTVNGTGVLLSGSAPFVMNFGHARNNTDAGVQYYYFGPQMDVDPVGIGSNERRRVQILQDCFLRKIVWTSLADKNAPTPSDAMTGYFKNFGNNALTDEPSPGIQVTSAINIPSTNTMYSNSTGTLNIPITSGNYVSFYYQTDFTAGSDNLASGLAVNVSAYFE